MGKPPEVKHSGRKWRKHERPSGEARCAERIPTPTRLKRATWCSALGDAASPKTAVAVRSALIRPNRHDHFLEGRSVRITVMTVRGRKEGSDRESDVSLTTDGASLPRPRTVVVSRPTVAPWFVHRSSLRQVRCDKSSVRLDQSGPVHERPGKAGSRTSGQPNGLGHRQHGPPVFTPQGERSGAFCPDL